MKRIIIICEGPTEQVFCNRILAPYFVEKGIHIQAPTIKHTKGGIVKWPILKKQIEIHLEAERDAFVTTFIDYYGLYQKHEFPAWDGAMRIMDRILRMEALEQGMNEDITAVHGRRFIPYLQLHEFEGLLFNDIDIFCQVIPKADLVGMGELQGIFERYDNPELINDNPETSPSHRLTRIIRGYNKVVYGDILAEAIGLERIRQKCPRFNSWITRLEEL